MKTETQIDSKLKTYLEAKEDGVASYTVDAILNVLRWVLK